MLNSKLNNGAGNSVPENAGKVKDFEALKRDFETVHASGKDYTRELQSLAKAVTHSVVNKCIDPQRKTALGLDKVSDNGGNPVMLELKRGIEHDLRTLDLTAQNANKATRATLDKDGNPITETVDKEAEAALDSLIEDTLSDGIDLVQEAACALLEQAAKHAYGTGWLDRPYTIRRLDKRVYVRLEDSAAYKDVETTPIQEAYRAVRQAVQKSRAVRTDPRNGYTYIEDVVDGLETIYYRLGKYADLGGYPNNGDKSLPGAPMGIGSGMSLYTTDIVTVGRTSKLIKRMELTPRQREVLEMLLRGQGYKAMATYFGVTQRAIAKTVEQIRRKAEDMGLFPGK